MSAQVNTRAAGMFFRMAEDAVRIVSSGDTYQRASASETGALVASGSSEPMPAARVCRDLGRAAWIGTVEGYIERVLFACDGNNDQTIYDIIRYLADDNADLTAYDFPGNVLPGILAAHAVRDTKGVLPRMMDGDLWRFVNSIPTLGINRNPRTPPSGCTPLEPLLLTETASGDNVVSEDAIGSCATHLIQHDEHPDDPSWCDRDVIEDYVRRLAPFIANRYASADREHASARNISKLAIRVVGELYGNTVAKQIADDIIDNFGESPFDYERRSLATAYVSSPDFWRKACAIYASDSVTGGVADRYWGSFLAPGILAPRTNAVRWALVNMTLARISHIGMMIPQWYVRYTKATASFDYALVVSCRSGQLSVSVSGVDFDAPAEPPAWSYSQGPSTAEISLDKSFGVSRFDLWQRLYLDFEDMEAHLPYGDEHAAGESEFLGRIGQGEAGVHTFDKQGWPGQVVIRESDFPAIGSLVNENLMIATFAPDRLFSGAYDGDDRTSGDFAARFSVAMWDDYDGEADYSSGSTWTLPASTLEIGLVHIDSPSYPSDVAVQRYIGSPSAGYNRFNLSIMSRLHKLVGSTEADRKTFATVGAAQTDRTVPTAAAALDRILNMTSDGGLDASSCLPTALAELVASEENRLADRQSILADMTAAYNEALKVGGRFMTAAEVKQMIENRIAQIQWTLDAPITSTCKVCVLWAETRMQGLVPVGSGWIDDDGLVHPFDATTLQGYGRFMKRSISWEEAGLPFAATELDSDTCRYQYTGENLGSYLSWTFAWRGLSGW